MVTPEEIIGALKSSGQRDFSHILILQGQCYPCTGNRIVQSLRASGISEQGMPRHVRGYPNINDVQWADVTPPGMRSHPWQHVLAYLLGRPGLGPVRHDRWRNPQYLDRARLGMHLRRSPETPEVTRRRGNTYGLRHYLENGPRVAREARDPRNLRDWADAMNEVYLMNIQERWKATQPRHYYLEYEER